MYASFCVSWYVCGENRTEKLRNVCKLLYKLVYVCVCGGGGQTGETGRTGRGGG